MRSPGILFAVCVCEGVPGDGVGQTITYVFAKPETIVGFQMIPLFGKSFALAGANGRPTSIRIDTDAGAFEADFDDLVPIVKKKNPVKEVDDGDTCGDETCMSRDDRIGGERGIRLPKPVKTSKVVFTLLDVVPGAKYHDTCMSQLEAYRPD